MNSTVSAWKTTPIPTNGTSQTIGKAFGLEHLILGSLIIIVALIGLGGNATVLWLLGFRMRRNAFNVYILNLALADFFLLCCLIIDHLLLSIQFFHISSISAYVLFILLHVTFFPYTVDLSILTAISTERCLSVLWPIWYHCHRSTSSSAVVCALLWALALILNLLECIYCIRQSKHHDEYQCNKINYTLASWLIFLFLVLLGSSLALLVRVLRGSHRVQLSRLYVTVLLTVLVFLLCGLPFGLFLLIVTNNIPLNFKYFSIIHLIVAVLSSVNSCVNPIIYFFVGSFRQQKRQPLKLVLERALEGNPEDDE
ncbi:mas-related G-protein coupled receptor member X2-like [Ochotona curzoniae]|uniref:mas-related G-protein coupled receptor member X2-like n=1 Tax=Ochotona curzoniae TaxID=130825 RepID=UPI001B34F260|nr:mas-related G-protein coupled receptor member X2-like [Ochotona curzoniae]